MRSCVKAGMNIKANLICGFPDENRQHLFETLISIVRMAWVGCHDLSINQYSPYPGSELYEQLVRNNLSFFPKKLNLNKKNRIEEYLEKKLNNQNKRYKLLYMFNKIGYDTRQATKDKKKYSMLIKAYQMHYRQRLVSGELDAETYNLILSHYNEIERVVDQGVIF